MNRNWVSNFDKFPFFHLALIMMALFVTGLAGQTPVDPPKQVTEKPDRKKNVSCNSEKEPNCDEIKKLTVEIARDTKALNEIQVENEKLRRSEAFWLGFHYRKRGDLYNGSKDYTRALRDYDKAIEYGVSDGMTFMDRADIYVMQGKYEDALKDYDTAIKNRPELAGAFLGRGNVYMHRREYDAAFENYDRAVELDRRLAEAYFGRGTIFLKRGNDFRAAGNEYLATSAFKSAADDFDSVLEINLSKTDAVTFRMLAKAQEALGNEPEAKKNRQKAEEVPEKENN